MAVCAWAFAPGASAQGFQSLAGVDQPAALTLDLGKNPSRKKKAARTAPAVSAEDAGRAARLAEARRKFFAPHTDDPKSDTVRDFGGYDYKKDSGSSGPGASFKF